jgi:hypothetical protein
MSHSHLVAPAGWPGPTHNSIIENLSTLRTSDINDRERTLLDKVKTLKSDNKKLMLLLKDSESTLADKIAR